MSTKTKLGTKISSNVRGIFYICEYDRTEQTICVVDELLCESAFDALNYYANTPNPESQLATGETYEELMLNLEKLHINMEDKDWLIELGECI